MTADVSVFLLESWHHFLSLIQCFFHRLSEKNQVALRNWDLRILTELNNQHWKNYNSQEHVRIYGKWCLLKATIKTLLINKQRYLIIFHITAYWSKHMKAHNVLFGRSWVITISYLIIIRKCQWGFEWGCNSGFTLAVLENNWSVLIKQYLWAVWQTNNRGKQGLKKRWGVKQQLVVSLYLR